MNKSWHVHYLNKYPGGSVRSSGSGMDVYNAEGEHVVALRQNGAGQLLDESEALGLRDRHDLAPIPKEARVYKIKDGKIGKSEEFEDRMAARENHVCPERGDVVLSCEDWKKHGKSFDEKQKVI